jgi:hypothetical protein
MLRGRCLLTAGALAAMIVASTIARPALACSIPTDRYGSVVNFGMTIGFSVLRRFAFTYGADIRIGHGPVIGWARIEGHGLSYVRTAAGVKAYHPGTGIQGEAGVAFNSAHRRDGIGQAFGLHLAAGRWNPVADAQVQGTVPLVGDRENYDLGLAAFVTTPGNWLYAIGCNG